MMQKKATLDWKAIEIKGLSYYVDKGYKVLVKLVDNS